MSSTWSKLFLSALISAYSFQKGSDFALNFSQTSIDAPASTSGLLDMEIFIRIFIIPYQAITPTKYEEYDEKFERKDEFKPDVDEECDHYLNLLKPDNYSVLLKSSHFFNQKEARLCNKGYLIGIGQGTEREIKNLLKENKIAQWIFKNFKIKISGFEAEVINVNNLHALQKHSGRKAMNYNDFYLFSQNYSSCVGCAVLDFEYFDEMSGYDMDQIFFQFYNWANSNKLSGYYYYYYYYPYNSICSMKITLLAATKLISKSPYDVKSRFCDSYMYPWYFRFNYMGTDCQNDYENIFVAYLDYNLICLKQYWEIAYNKYTYSYFYKIQNTVYQIEEFFKKMFYLGWKSLGSETNVQSSITESDSVISLNFKIDITSSFPLFQDYSCVGPSYIILQSVTTLLKVSPYSDVVHVSSFIAGYVENYGPNQYHQFYYPSQFHCGSYSSLLKFNVSSYKDIQNGIKYIFDSPVSYTISNVSIHFECIYGMFLNILNCNQSQCQVCEEYEICNQCDWGFYLSEGFCFNCPSVCNGCSSNSNCYNCIYRHGRSYNDGLCYPCGKDCDYCYYMYNCDSCIYLYGKNSTNPRDCLPCLDSNCNYCYYYDTCTYCINGYGLNSNGTCVPCLGPNCQVCSTDYTYCVYCITGFVKPYGSNTCNACPSKCEYCNENFYCYDCYFGYGLNVYTRNCEPCGQNCQDCYYTYECSSCMPGFCYGGPVGSCGIHEDCLECNSYMTCATCKIGYFIPSNIEGCDCGDRYYIDSENNCKPCMAECLTCTDNSTCSQCIAKNAIYDDNLGCVCSPRYFKYNSMTEPDACQMCEPSCATCSSYSFCETCISINASPNSNGACECNQGFFLISSFYDIWSCSPCEISCKVCVSYYECIECYLAFALPMYDNSYCVCETG